MRATIISNIVGIQYDHQYNDKHGRIEILLEEGDKKAIAYLLATKKVAYHLYKKLQHTQRINAIVQILQDPKNYGRNIIMIEKIIDFVSGDTRRKIA